VTQHPSRNDDGNRPEPIKVDVPRFLKRRLPPPSLTPSRPETPATPQEDHPNEFAAASPELTSIPADTERTRNPLAAGVKTAYRKTVKTICQAGSGILEARAGLGTGALLMTDEEAGDIADPAARLLARHAPVSDAGPVTDLADVVALIVGVAGYGLAAFTRRAQTLAALSAGAFTGNPPPEPAAAAQPEPTPIPNNGTGGPLPSWPHPQAAAMTGLDR
jgi:hypothetical protein